MPKVSNERRKCSTSYGRSGSDTRSEEEPGLAISALGTFMRPMTANLVGRCSRRKRVDYSGMYNHRHHKNACNDSKQVELPVPKSILKGKSATCNDTSGKGTSLFERSSQLPLSDVTSCFVKLSRLDDSIITLWTQNNTTPESGIREWFPDHEKKDALKPKIPTKVKDALKPKFPTKVKTRELSEYEKMVQRNKEEKIAFLKSLKMDEIKASFAEAVKGHVRQYVKINWRQEVPPREKVCRLSKREGVDLSEHAIAARALEETVSTPVFSFEKVMRDANFYDDFVDDFDGLNYTTAEPIDHKPHFERMQFYKSQVVLGGVCRSVTVLPIHDKVIVCAGNSYGRLGVWDVDSDSVPYIFETHTKTISHLKAHPDKSNIIVSSSLDGTLCCGDLETKVFFKLYDVSDETACTYFDFLSPTTFLVAQRNGNISVLDQRTRSVKHEIEQQFSDYMKLSIGSPLKKSCHRGGVNTVSVHPNNNNCFISTGKGGDVCVWDLRRFQKPVWYQHDKSYSAISALYSPTSGNSVLVTGDDAIRMYSCSRAIQSLTLKHILKQRNITKKEFYATWLPKDNAFVIGSWTVPRTIQIYNGKCDNIYNFKCGTLQKFNSCFNNFHPSLPVLISTSLGGKAYVFSNID